MPQCTALLLFESSENHAVVNDPANEAWVTLLDKLNDGRFELLDRRYYLGLRYLRKQKNRSLLPGQMPVVAKGKEQAQQQMLAMLEQRKESKSQTAGQQAAAVFVEPLPLDEQLPEALRDFTKLPPPKSMLLDGPGRPPCDALCLLRAFLAAPLLNVDDSPTNVYQLLHNNPTFARHCGFLGRNVLKQEGELTSRQLPSLSVCEEFDTVMTRYGLWYLARRQQVRENLASGAVKSEETIVFDTTHIKANSHCANVVPANTNSDKDNKNKPKHRKVPRVHKRCTCGKQAWEGCEHPWFPTDSGAAVIVKGKTRIYWGHKASLASFANSEVPFDVRVCQYGAVNDGKTLIPHLEVLMREFPECVALVLYILADDAYRYNKRAVSRFGKQARLIVPVHGRKADAALVERFERISHFTPSGVPVCENGHRFQMLGRDIKSERYIWAAPVRQEGQPICNACSSRKGTRRHIRVPRDRQPHIDWEHPQHLAREQARYRKRTGVERAIKRLKVDLRGEHLTHRDALRVQAHLDRKLLTLHLLLS